MCRGIQIACPGARESQCIKTLRVRARCAQPSRFVTLVTEVPAMPNPRVARDIRTQQTKQNEYVQAIVPLKSYYAN